MTKERDNPVARLVYGLGLALCVVIGFVADASVWWMLILLAAAIPTYLAWRKIYRPYPQYPPGHCRKCGYDLTGNVTGKCSECGAETEGDK